jgi:hypothetical protein
MQIFKLSLLGFYLNGLLDSGNYQSVTIEEIVEKIKDKTIFKYLKENFNIDVGYLTDANKEEIIDEWLSMWSSIDEDRKLVVRNNGLCLLIAYLFEGIQSRVGMKLDIESIYPRNK